MHPLWSPLTILDPKPKPKHQSSFVFTAASSVSCYHTYVCVYEYVCARCTRTAQRDRVRGLGRAAVPAFTSHPPSARARAAILVRHREFVSVYNGAHCRAPGALGGAVQESAEDRGLFGTLTPATTKGYCDSPCSDRDGWRRPVVALTITEGGAERKKCLGSRGKI
jgi:hypothetical protein